MAPRRCFNRSDSSLTITFAGHNSAAGDRVWHVGVALKLLLSAGKLQVTLKRKTYCKILTLILHLEEIRYCLKGNITQFGTLKVQHYYDIVGHTGAGGILLQLILESVLLHFFFLKS